MTDLVERVAAAFVPMFQKNADGYGRHETDPDGQGELWTRPTELAELALTALSEAGLAIVPAGLVEDLVTERDMAEAYYPTLETHLREHGCAHDFSEVANANGKLEPTDD